MYGINNLIKIINKDFRGNMNNNYGLKIYYISTMIMAILIVIAIITNNYLNKSLIFSKALNLPTKYNQHFHLSHYHQTYQI